MPAPGNRAWATRALSDPARWARSLPVEWTPHTVSFRRAPVVESHGGYSATGPPEEYLSTRAYVYWGSMGEPSGPYDLGIGIVSRKMLRVVMPLPEDPALYPLKGDQMVWTDDLGQTYTTNVRNTHSPKGLADHLEVETEALR